MRWLVVGVTTALLVAGCGIPSDDDADVTDAADVPFDLLEPAPTTTTTTPVGSDAELFFIGADELIHPTIRRVPTGSTLTELVDALSSPPQETDLRTALQDELVLNVDLSGGIAQVNLGPEFAESADQVLAIAQIVYTLTGQPGVGRVTFLLEGTPVPIPRGDGVITTDSVARDAYANLVAP